jgi:hypothetical protein
MRSIVPRNDNSSTQCLRWYDAEGPFALWRKWAEHAVDAPFKAGTFFPEAAPEHTALALREFFARSKPGSPDGTKGWNMLSSEQRRAGFVFASAVGEIAMSLGTILVIILIIFLLGGFSGRFGGYGYGMGHSAMGLGGVILIVLIILLLLGKL